MNKLVLLLSVFSLPIYGQTVNSVTDSKKLKLVWSDEFNYSGLPDSTKWSYEKGFVRGFEKQFYTVKNKNNAVVRDGNLIITAKKERIKNPNIVPDKKVYPVKFKGKSIDSIPNDVKNKYEEFTQYTSASLITLGKASWTYGRIEVRAKLPKGKGVWPAIWMLGENRGKVGWPKCGEIDIAEYVGRNPNRLYATTHSFNASKRKKISNGQITNINTPPFDSFHTYSVDWSNTELIFYFDNNEYHRVSIDTSDRDNPFNKPFYLILNFALGGKFAGQLDESILPQQFVIDYVRIYQ